jgi:hypothetical protein
MVCAILMIWSISAVSRSIAGGWPGADAVSAFLLTAPSPRHLPGDQSGQAFRAPSPIRSPWQRDQQAEAFLDVILEGPTKWKIRPVFEVLYDKVWTQTETYSGLVGAIWQVRTLMRLGFSTCNTPHLAACQSLAGKTTNRRAVRRETRMSGSEGGGIETNRCFLPL